MSEKEDPESERTLTIWGRDVSKIPCFRNSFLYGITGGLGVGFVTFMGTSRPALAAHATMGTFMSVTMIYWFTCRYQFSKKRFEMHQMQRAMRERVAIEGTSRENDFLANRSTEAKEA